MSTIDEYEGHKFSTSTTYVNDKQTIRIDCDRCQCEFGAIQQNSKGKWLPRWGQGPCSELPPTTDTLFPTEYVALALQWVEDRHVFGPPAQEVLL